MWQTRVEHARAAGARADEWPAANELSAAFAERLTREAGTDSAPVHVVDRAYWLAAGRAPTAPEKKLGVDFLRSGAPVKEFALAMFNLNAFLYVP